MLLNTVFSLSKSPPHLLFSPVYLKLCSKEARLGGQVLTDMMSPTEPIASKKNLFEVGDAWNQNMGPVTASKVKMIMNTSVLV